MARQKKEGNQKKTLTLSLSREIIKRIKYLAADKEKKQNEIVEIAINELWDKQKKTG